MIADLLGRTMLTVGLTFLACVALGIVHPDLDTVRLTAVGALSCVMGIFAIQLADK